MSNHENDVKLNCTMVLRIEALQVLLQSLEQVCGAVSGTMEDFMFLQKFLRKKELNALVQVYNNLNECGQIQPKPVEFNASTLVSEVVEELEHKCNRGECQELAQILRSHHFQAIIEAHDQIAQQDFQPKLPEIPHAVDEDEETVKIVQLVKSNEPLGATIKCEEKSGAIVIARIMHGGAADRSGLVHVGDEVHEVNGINVKGKAPGDVLSILQSLDGTITLKLIPADERPQLRTSKVRMRVHFDYDPKTDPKNPCREAGLTFKKGDVLHIVNQDDPNWWQARREGDRTTRAGLIPGRQLQERRILDQRNAEFSMPEEEILPSCKSGSNVIRSRKIKKIMYEAKENDDFDREEIATYEEVARLYPRPGIFRPVILIGPPGVGRNELKRRVMALDPNHFKTTIPHTSRTKKAVEVDGVEYYFVPRAEMDREVELGSFVEYGEYKENLYGTSIDTVKAIINTGYVCVMNPHYQAIKMLRTSELKPYMIFIKPPSFERLKMTRQSVHARSTFDETSSRGFTDNEFHDIIRSSNRIEFLYSHMFDATVVNDDLMTAFEELVALVRKVELEPQWVLASWVH